jgi:hypothetical protein
MNKLFITMVAAAPLWASCQKAEIDWTTIPIVRGEQATLAFSDWKSSLDSKIEIDFPVTVHWEMDFTAKEVPQPLGEPTNGLATLVVDSTLLGGNNYRSRIVMEIVAPGFDTFITVWLESDSKELRLRHRGLDSIGTMGLPFSLPAGLRLSADRQTSMVDFLKRVGGQMAGMADLDIGALESAQGFSEIFHPNNMLHFLGPGTLQQQTGWCETASAVQVTVVPLKAMVESPVFEEIRSNEMFASLEQLKDVESVVEFDRESGAFRSLDSSFNYNFQGIPTRGETQPSMLVELHMELRNTQVGALSFKSRDEILDLDESFDSYWPTLTAMEPLLLQSFKKAKEDLDSGEDFSF